jgi:hypothetical protein
MSLLWIGLIGLTVFSYILFSINPESSDLITKGAFFASLYVILIALSVFIVYFLRVLVGNREVVFAHFPQSLRQGVLLATLAIGILILKALRTLTIWDALLLFGALFLIELSFRSRKL